MKNIEIISASAGSGKTYRLAKALAEAIEKDGVRPEAVVATTFTRKAAAELHERVRTRLLDKGLLVEAQRLSAARIGTVNSVCGGLVGEFALELGLSPEVDIMSEELAKTAIAEAISEVASAEQTEQIGVLSARFGDFEWQEAVSHVVGASRANGLEPAFLDVCAERSARSLFVYFDEAAGIADELDAALVKAAQDFVGGVDQSVDKTGATREYLSIARRVTRQQTMGIAWDIWMKLAGKGPGAKSRAAAKPLQASAGKYTRHPRFREDLERAIELVFGLARAALERYEQRKRAVGAMDFVDQEALALGLLRRSDIQATQAWCCSPDRRART